MGQWLKKDDDLGPKIDNLFSSLMAFSFLATIPLSIIWMPIKDGIAVSEMKSWLNSSSMLFSSEAPAVMDSSYWTPKIKGNFVVYWIGDLSKLSTIWTARTDIGALGDGSTSFLIFADYVVILRPDYIHEESVDTTLTIISKASPFDNSKITRRNDTKKEKAYTVDAWVVKKDSMQAVASLSFLHPGEWSDKGGTVRLYQLADVYRWLSRLGLPEKPNQIPPTRNR